MHKESRYKWIKGGVSSPQGFAASGIRIGVKEHAAPDKKDMALIFSEHPAVAAGVFTLNNVKAAPVILCQRHLERQKGMRAVIVNSGNANACTGKRGLADAEKTAALTSKALETSASSVLVCSTGTIGVPLPMDKIAGGITLACKNLSRAGGADAARAIMTTDTCAKQVAVRFKIDGRDVLIGAVAKGAGMIAPNMATLLVFITTDAMVGRKALQSALAVAVDKSFNRVLVDGDQSTNDTVLCLANGAAGNFSLTERHPGWPVFRKALEEVCRRLAEMIIRDGEGVTKVIRLTVKGAIDDADAEMAARAIAHSLLVKTSWFGADPNWGRVMCAVGYSGARIIPEKISIRYDNKPAVLRGRASGLPPEQLHRIISKKEFSIEIDLRQGKGTYSMLTCDCSLEYVKINADYMT